MALLPQVVVIEDDAATRKALGRLLRAGGFESRPYASAEDYLAAPPARPPACLVLDVGLGEMSGVDLLRRLRAAGSELPVIIMTGHDDNAVRTEALALGCSALLLKDTDGDVLLELLRQLVDTHG